MSKNHNQLIAAIIPAVNGDHYSSDLGGAPLLAWSVLAAREAKLINQIIVATDSPKTADLAYELGADVHFISAKAVSDSSATTAVVNALRAKGCGDLVRAVLPAQFPFRTPELINRAIALCRMYSLRVKSGIGVAFDPEQWYGKSKTGWTHLSAESPRTLIEVSQSIDVNGDYQSSVPFVEQEDFIDYLSHIRILLAKMEHTADDESALWEQLIAISDSIQIALGDVLPRHTTRPKWKMWQKRIFIELQYRLFNCSIQSASDLLEASKLVRQFALPWTPTGATSGKTPLRTVAFCKENNTAAAAEKSNRVYLNKNRQLNPSYIEVFKEKGSLHFERNVSNLQARALSFDLTGSRNNNLTLVPVESPQKGDLIRIAVTAIEPHLKVNHLGCIIFDGSLWRQKKLFLGPQDQELALRGNGVSPRFHLPDKFTEVTVWWLRHHLPLAQEALFFETFEPKEWLKFFHSTSTWINLQSGKTVTNAADLPEIFPLASECFPLAKIDDSTQLEVQLVDEV